MCVWLFSKKTQDLMATDHNYEPPSGWSESGNEHTQTHTKVEQHHYAVPLPLTPLFLLPLTQSRRGLVGEQQARAREQLCGDGQPPLLAPRYSPRQTAPDAGVLHALQPQVSEHLLRAPWMTMGMDGHEDRQGRGLS